MSAEVILNHKGPTSLRLYVGVITRFEPRHGDLECGIVMVLAEDHHAASVFVATHFEDYDLQCLTCLTDFPWFLRLILDDSCPDADALRGFVIENVDQYPADDEGTYR